MKIENYYKKLTLIIAVSCFLFSLIVIFIIDQISENEKLIEISGRLEYSPIVGEIDNNYYVDLKIMENPNIFKIDNNWIVQNDSLISQITTLPPNTWISIKIIEADKAAKHHEIKSKPIVYFFKTNNKTIIDENVFEIADERGKTTLIIVSLLFIIAYTVFNNKDRFNSTFDERYIYPRGDFIRDIKEQVIWSGSPKILPYLFSAVLFFLLLFYAFGFYILLQNSHRIWGFYPDLIIAYLLMASLPVGLLIATIIAYNTKYYITEKYMYFVVSFLFDNVKRIKKSQIKSMVEKSNFFERLFDVITVGFYSGKLGDENEKIFDEFRCINEYEIIDYGIKTTDNTQYKA